MPASNHLQITMLGATLGCPHWLSTLPITQWNGAKRIIPQLMSTTLAPGCYDLISAAHALIKYISNLQRLPVPTTTSLPFVLAQHERVVVVSDFKFNAIPSMGTRHHVSSAIVSRTLTCTHDRRASFVITVMIISIKQHNLCYCVPLHLCYAVGHAPCNAQSTFA